MKSVLNSMPLARQWALGTLLASLPLIAAVAYAIWSMEQHNRKQQELVETAVVVNRQLVGLQDQVKELERSARQYAVLRDERFGTIYQEKYDSLSQLVLTFKSAAASAQLEQSLDRLLRLLRAATLEPLTNEPSQAKALGQLTETFNQATDILSRISDLTHTLVSEGLQKQKDAFENTQWYLAFLGFMALPASIGFQFWWTYMVAKPMNRLSTIIGLIGRGDLEQSTALEGPQELKVLGERLNWLRVTLKTIENQKNTFLRHVTHELKTPLAAMFEASALLQEEVPGPLTAEQRSVVAILSDNAARLQEMIHQLLNFNSVRLAAGSNAEIVALRPMLQQVRENYDSLIRSRQLEVTLEGGDMDVESDTMLLQMVAANLLSNALHFSPTGSRVVVSWGSEPQGWWFEVADQGPGIPEPERDKVFVPFYQGTNKREGSTKGSGLGLAIVGECVSQLSGVIEIQDNQPRGTRIKITF
ncbi:sensor histidine kinase [Hahella ganghwensis]|uniref:sensor histidine kinase n=1 Tax=Hahella ganghwensis TaxID=286420 RepID=UPI00039AD2E6|nr:HAMP domain-containing sensor histidine kinase [Hahella ganghwensis]